MNPNKIPKIKFFNNNSQIKKLRIKKLTERMDLETIKVWKKLINNLLVKKKSIPEFFSELMALLMLFGGKE